MTDTLPPDPDDVAADDLLASRALDGDLSAPEWEAFLADPRHEVRRDAMKAAQAWLSDVPVDASVTASAVAYALAATEGISSVAPVVPLVRRRLPVWLGAAASLVVIVTGALVLTRTSGDEQQPLANDATDSTVATRGIATTQANDPASAAVETTTTPAPTEPVDPSGLGRAVITVNLGSQDPDTEPFPVPEDDELVQMPTKDEVAWLAEWVRPEKRTASVCREGARVLLPEALFGADAAVLVEVVLNPPRERVIAFALDDCAKVASVAVE